MNFWIVCSMSRSRVSATSEESTRTHLTAAATIHVGIKEQLIFPEIDYDKIDKIRGMDISIRYNSKNRRGSPRAFNTDGRTVREIRGRENKMAKTSMKIKQQRTPKFSTRAYNRCKICGRPHAYLRKYGICRICFRELAYKGQIPGVKKASW